MLAKKELQQNNQNLHHHHHNHGLAVEAKIGGPTAMEGVDVGTIKDLMAVAADVLEKSDNGSEDDFEDVYGELVVLGFNGIKPQHWLIHSSSAARRDLCTKYRLRRRYQPNGVIATQKMKSQTQSVRGPAFQNNNHDAMRARTTHSVSYKMSKSEVLVEEYLHDDFTDLFQVGRSTERPIDFTVRDYWPTLPSQQSHAGGAVLNKSASVDSGESSGEIVVVSSSHQQQQQPGSGNKQSAGAKMSLPAPMPPPGAAGAAESTISRFACRIIVNRTRPFHPRIFAAGFDNDNNIFLGEKAIKWNSSDDGKGTLDALTTNGVLIMKPLGGELWQSTVQPGAFWREVSVCGAVSAVRPARSSKDRGQAKPNETNVLIDGTMIDLCGVTLLYRSPEGLLKSPKLEDLEHCLGALNAGRPQCPVGLNTLVIPKQKPHGAAARTDRDPYAYLPCGHVQGRHPWGKQPNHLRRCPMCFREGKAIRLCMGMEPAFYVGVAVSVPDHAFIPCGHIASKATCQYWSQVMVPIETTSFRPSTAVCPFCGTALNKKQPFVRLIYQTEQEMT